MARRSVSRKIIPTNDSLFQTLDTAWAGCRMEVQIRSDRKERSREKTIRGEKARRWGRLLAAIQQTIEDAIRAIHIDPEKVIQPVRIKHRIVINNNREKKLLCGRDGKITNGGKGDVSSIVLCKTINEPLIECTEKNCITCCRYCKHYHLYIYIYKEEEEKSLINQPPGLIQNMSKRVSKKHNDWNICLVFLGLFVGGLHGVFDVKDVANDLVILLHQDVVDILQLGNRNHLYIW